MSQFFADFVFLLELVIIAGGLGLLHKANRESPAMLLRLAGYILVIGGVATALCTGYFWFKYHAQGDFNTAQLNIRHEMSMDMTKPMNQGHSMGMMNNKETSNGLEAGSNRGAAEHESDVYGRHH